MAKLLKRNILGLPMFEMRLANGCTSGHGICGNALLRPRSITATLIFMATAIVVVWITRHGMGS